MNTQEESIKWDIKIRFKCIDCGLYQPKTSELLAHTISKHCVDGKLYHCYLCSDYSVKMNHKYNVHLIKKHGVTNGVIRCPLCRSRFFSTEKEILDHIFKVHWTVVLLYYCRLCSYRCESEIHFHITDKHPQVIDSNDKSLRRTYNITCYSCNINCCSFKGIDPYDLLRHIMCTHFPVLISEYHCNYCNNYFISLKDLDNHCVYDRLFPKKRVPCGSSNNSKHLSLPPTLDVNHKLRLTIYCRICSEYKCNKLKTFFIHMMKYHMVLYKCPFNSCDYTTYKFSDFWYHEVVEHLCNEVYECHICYYKCSQKDGLDTHFTDMHSTEKLALCQCSYSGSWVDHLEDDHGYTLTTEFCRICGTIMCYYKCHLLEKHGIEYPEILDYIEN